MKIGYARVSTKDQNLEMQLSALNDYGCERIFQEKQSAVKVRPELEKLLGKLRKGDVVVVWKLDRLGRSLKDLIDLVTKMEKERREWFYRVLSPLTKGLRLLASKPSFDLATLIGNSLSVGAGVTVDLAQQLRKVESLKQDSGLTYVLELNSFLEKAAVERDDAAS